jgi:hypothetical protein
MTRTLHLLVLVAAVSGAAVSAQQPPAVEKPQPEAPAAPAPAPPPMAPQGYAYDSAGRRDPFVSLLRRGTDPKSAGSRPAGPPGLMIGEVTVKGIVRDRSGFIAMVQGPDNKQTFMVRPGEKLMDGTVKAITADAVVFSQDVNDPMSMVKQKEIRKTVRPVDGGRG